MLKSIDPILTPDLLWLLAAMGHGDDLAVVDDNHPAERIARNTSSQRLIRLPGLTMSVAVRAILSLYPLDDFEPDPVRVMIPVDGGPEPEVQREVAGEISRSTGSALAFGKLDRSEFYRVAASSFGVVQVGDSRSYGCFLFRKGVLPG
jgi:L-fucose mutarotase